MSSQNKRRCLQSGFPALLVFLVLLPLLSLAEPRPDTGAKRSGGTGKDQSAMYIIRLAEPPLLEYLLEGPRSLALERRGPGRKKPDFRAPEAMGHLNRIKKQQEEFGFKAQQALARVLDTHHAYIYAFNGLAVKLTPGEANAIADLPGVVQVQPEVMRFLLGDAGPAWIGAPGVWDGAGTAGRGTRGEGIVIAVLDTGIHPEHPSFAQIDGDEYVHANPRGRFFGVCDEENTAVYDPAFPCNDKLIGAWSFVNRNTDPTSPRDSDGHGTHVTATAAGNAVNTDQIVPEQFGVSLSGVAPRANIIVYDVCETDCPESAALAAIDQAVADGVDVINFSIGGPALNPWNDPISLALLIARESGVFVSVAAGNNGPAEGSVASPANAPWVTAVGDATHNRRFTDQLLLLNEPGPPSPMRGAGNTRSHGPAPMIYAGASGDPLCLRPFPAGTWQNGEIVICDRGENPRVEKGANVKAGGAGGMVLVNQSTDSGLVADFHVLPAIHLSFDDGESLKNRLNTDGPGSLLGTIQGSERLLDPSFGDMVPSFSSRGPNSLVPDLIKPDLVAPGVFVLAAGLPVQTENTTFFLLSGTSASAPHAAGAAALLMSLHPEWTPDMIRSALMTTAETAGVLKQNGASPANPFDRGAGRIKITDAARAGLVLQESTENYLAAEPALGGDPRTLNLPSLADDNCRGICSWRRTLNSTLDVLSTWSVSASGASGLNLTISPSSFALPPGGSVTILVEADVRGMPGNQWSFDEVVLSSPSSSEIRLPVAAFVTAEATALQSSGGGCMISSIHSEALFGPELYPAGAIALLVLLLASAPAASSRRAAPCGSPSAAASSASSHFRPGASSTAP
jgi:subtilisin family serine protease